MAADLYKIADELRAMKCDVHGNNPQVWVDGESVKFKNACCDEFAKQVSDKYGELIHEQVTRGLFGGS